MGGIGSGRHWQFGSKDTTVTALNTQGLLDQLIPRTFRYVYKPTPSLARYIFDARH